MDYLMEAELKARAATTADELDDTPEHAKCGRCHAGTLVYGADLGNAELGRIDTTPSPGLAGCTTSIGSWDPKPGYGTPANVEVSMERINQFLTYEPWNTR